LRRNCLLKQVIEGKGERIEEEAENGRRFWTILRKSKILELERGSTRSHSVENWLWKWLWTCRKTYYYAVNDCAVSFCQWAGDTEEIRKILS